MNLFVISIMSVALTINYHEVSINCNHLQPTIHELIMPQALKQLTYS
jgi:hypothetical protein